VRRRIAVLTGSRADYGLLRPLLQELRDGAAVQLQLIATGAHLAPEFGSTYREIEADGFSVDRAIDLQLGDDTPVGVGHAMGRALSGLADVLAALRSDLLVLLGDRYEVLCAAAAALVARVPIAHLHGGEITEGAFDDAIRHAVTKMSHLHFVAAEEYRRRVLQMGESADRVFLVGGLGVDAITRLELLDRPALERELGFRFCAKSLLITFHPATLDPTESSTQIAELLAALAPLDDTTLIFTMPNADPGNRAIAAAIDAFAAAHPNAAVFTSLGQRRYFSCVRQVDGVLGNSSSGLTEVPTFGKVTINVGDRQRGRLRANSVFDCEPDRQSIAEALRRLYAPGVMTQAAAATNPYGDGGASGRIRSVLERFPLSELTRKTFVDHAC
jgi:GDP/UDP-N,N'-diacetylbacillosamine 2-epimerase (hydrolysing)